MVRITIDGLIALLQQEKDSGQPGDMVVAVQGRDTRGRGSFVNFDVQLRLALVAKSEFAKPWTLAKLVSRSGVPVLLLQARPAIAGAKVERVTIDGLMALLQKEKEQGASGDTVVALSGHDNNDQGGMANFEVFLHAAPVAMTDFEKPWGLAKLVSRGGVQVMLLG